MRRLSGVRFISKYSKYYYFSITYVCVEIPDIPNTWEKTTIVFHLIVL